MYNTADKVLAAPVTEFNVEEIRSVRGSLSALLQIAISLQITVLLQIATSLQIKFSLQIAILLQTTFLLQIKVLQFSTC